MTDCFSGLTVKSGEKRLWSLEGSYNSDLLDTRLIDAGERRERGEER